MTGNRRVARPTSEGERVTSFELFFDLVYVFAATRVTGYMAHAHDVAGVVQGVLILALLWSTWDSYAWLGNQARADNGVVRTAMAVAMAGMFVLALAIPEAWHDHEGGLDGPLTLVVAYVLVRCLHLIAYGLVAGEDTWLRRRVAIAWGPVVAGAVLLLAGALAGGWAQTAFFAGAVVAEWGGLYLATRGGGWPLRSVSHFTERHGLVVILAIGESLFAIGVGAADQAIDMPLIVAAVLGVAAALCLWWLYFNLISDDAEHRLLQASGVTQVRLAIEAYAYGHFPIVAGIIVGAVGVEGVLAHAGDSERLGWFSAALLYGGFALYLGGLLLFKQRVYGTFSMPRLRTAGVLLLALPAAAYLPPLAALAGLVLILVALIVLEARRYVAYRESVRIGAPVGPVAP